MKRVLAIGALSVTLGGCDSEPPDLTTEPRPDRAECLRLEGKELVWGSSDPAMHRRVEQLRRKLRRCGSDLP